jgi:hypothetical protein
MEYCFEINVQNMIGFVQYIIKIFGAAEMKELLFFVDLPACQSALQPWVSLGLLHNQSPSGVRFRTKIIFTGCDF